MSYTLQQGLMFANDSDYGTTSSTMDVPETDLRSHIEDIETTVTSVSYTFEGDVPNEETSRVFAEIERRENLKSFSSVRELLDEE